MTDRLAEIKAAMTEQWSVGNDLCRSTWNDIRWLLEAVEDTTNMYRSQLALTKLALKEIERLKALAQEPWSSKTYASVVADGMERAAAIAEEFLWLEAAHAIRAEIKA